MAAFDLCHCSHHRQRQNLYLLNISMCLYVYIIFKNSLDITIKLLHYRYFHFASGKTNLVDVKKLSGSYNWKGGGWIQLWLTPGFPILPYAGWLTVDIHCPGAGKLAVCTEWPEFTVSPQFSVARFFRSVYLFHSARPQILLQTKHPKSWLFSLFLMLGEETQPVIFLFLLHYFTRRKIIILRCQK